jgi:Outer membrane protein
VRRLAALLALLGTSCATMEPKLGQPDPAIPVSWPVGSAALTHAEASLPAVTYRQIFTDGRLQTLIGEALANNRDLAVAAANIAAAREQYRIQRAQQLPTVNGSAGVTVSGTARRMSARNISSARASRTSRSTCSAACGR